MLIGNVISIPFNPQISGGGSAVSLVIDYTATQFDFKWKAPSGSTVIFHWGDGTTDEVSGNDSTLVTTTSSYAGAGTYSFYLTGDVIDLTYIDIQNQTFVSGDVSGWSQLTNLTLIACRTTSVSGDISGWSALTSLTFLRCYSTLVTGDISGWSALTGLTDLQIRTTLLSGDISGFSSMTSIVTLSVNSTNVTFDSSPAWSVSGAALSFHDCAMTSTMVDNMIESLSTCTSSTTNVAGSNAHRTAASNDDLNTLLANGNTITLNDVLGSELIINGTMTAWTEPGAPNDYPDNWTLSGNDATHYISNNAGKVDVTTAGTSNLRIYQPVISSGNTYRIEGVLANLVTNIQVTVAGGVVGTGTINISSNGTFVVYLISTGTLVLIKLKSAGTGATFDDTSCKLVSLT